MTESLGSAETPAGGEALESELLRLFASLVVSRAAFTLDPGGSVVGWNQDAERAEGWTREGIVGRHVSALYAPDAVQARTPWLELERAEVDGRSRNDGWRVRQDGSQFRASLVTIAVRRTGGDLAGFVVVVEDLAAASDGAGPAARLARQEQMKRHLETGVIHTLFGVGMDLQSIATQVADSRLRARLETAIADLDHGIRELRAAVWEQT